jgi:hypothetical protein
MEDGIKRFERGTADPPPSFPPPPTNAELPAPTVPFRLLTLLGAPPVAKLP